MKHKLLLIGAGGWGNIHLKVCMANRKWSLAAVADADPQTRDRIVRETGLSPGAVFSDARKALEKAEYDAVSLIVPNPAKAPILIKALESQKPVFTEKPLTYYSRDLVRIHRAWKRAGSILMVSQNYRFEPQVRRMAEFVQKRKYWGELLSCNVRFARNVKEFLEHYVIKLPGATGLNSEMCIHHYDLMRFIMGENPKRIEASRREDGKGIVAGWTSIQARIEFPGGEVIDFSAGYDDGRSSTPWGGIWDFHFESGSLTMKPYAGGGFPVTLHSPWKKRWNIEPPGGNAGVNLKYHLVDRGFEEFTQALEEKRKPECGLEDNLETVAFMLAVEHAARTGRPVDFPKFLKGVLNKCQ